MSYPAVTDSAGTASGNVAEVAQPDFALIPLDSGDENKPEQQRSESPPGLFDSAPPSSKKTLLLEQPRLRRSNSAPARLQTLDPKVEQRLPESPPPRPPMPPPPPFLPTPLQTPDPKVDQRLPESPPPRPPMPPPPPFLPTPLQTPDPKVDQRLWESPPPRPSMPTPLRTPAPKGRPLRRENAVIYNEETGELVPPRQALFTQAHQYPGPSNSHTFEGLWESPPPRPSMPTPLRTPAPKGRPLRRESAFIYNEETGEFVHPRLALFTRAHQYPGPSNGHTDENEELEGDEDEETEPHSSTPSRKRLRDPEESDDSEERVGKRARRHV